MKTLDQIIAELPPQRQAEIKRRTLEMIREQLGPDLELVTESVETGITITAIARELERTQCSDIVRCSRCGKGTPQNEKRCRLCGAAQYPHPRDNA
jgi:hypothetical protein